MATTDSKQATAATTPPLRRIVIIANKFFEVDPLVAVLLPHGSSKDPDRVRPDELEQFVAVNHPLIRPPGYSEQDPPAKPRITLTCSKRATVEVWCLQDLMNTNMSGSSSAEKARVLPRALAGDPPALVIAFGTAGYPEASILNGSVVIGSRVFIHDPRTTEKTRYQPKRINEVTASNLPDKFFRNVDSHIRGPAEQAFLRTPLAPADPAVIMAGNNWISVGTVNVTNYDDYVWTDPEAIGAFKSLPPEKARGRIGSMETTHGIIQEISEPSSFLFVSGIANGIPYFDVQNVPRNYAQNFAAAHNAAVALAWLLPEAVQRLGL